jgi:choline kinase
MAKLRAAVLAAGRGIRMGGDGPKALMPVGDHKPLLHYILRGLKQQDIDDLMVITGFKPAAVQEFVSERWADATFVFNARYASWGNFHSVRMALDQSPGMDVMVVNSDIVVHPDVLRRVAGAPGDLVLAVERRHRFDSEDMRVTLSGNRVRAIAKGIKQAHTHAEFVGVSLIRPRAARLYSDLATDQQWYARTQVGYEDIYNLILTGINPSAVDVQRGEYARIMTPEDIPAAVDVVQRHAGAWNGGREGGGADRSVGAEAT